MFSIFLSLIFGILVGIICGLIPGIHPNLVNTLLLAFVMKTSINPLFLLVFIVSVSLTNVVVNFIPSVFVGVPEAGTELSILPAHKMLIRGAGPEAIRLFMLGCVGAVLFSSTLISASVFIIPKILPFLEKYVWVIIALISVFLMLKDRRISFFIFLLAGIVGVLSSKLPISQNLVLFPLLSGMFGMSTLILSMQKQEKIPRQDKKIVVSKNTIYNSVIKGSFAGLFTSLLPGISASAAAMLVSASSTESFLISVGSIQVINMFFSFLMLWLIGKGRSGSAVAIKQIVDVGITEIKLIIIIAVLSTLISVIITFKLSKFFAKYVEKINYRILTIFIMTVLTTLVIILTGPYGLLLFATCTCLGLLPPLLKIRRVHLMGALIIPTILYFLGI